MIPWTLAPWVNADRQSEANTAQADTHARSASDSGQSTGCKFLLKHVWTKAGVMEYFVLFFIHVGTWRGASG